MNNMKRRTFLKGTLAGSVLAVAAGAGLLRPTEVLAADWPKNAFTARNMNDALKGLFGSNSHKANKAIKIKAPIQAENGAVVPVAVDASKIKGAESVAIFVEKNPSRPSLGNKIDQRGMLRGSRSFVIVTFNSLARQSFP